MKKHPRTKTSDKQKKSAEKTVSKKTSTGYFLVPFLIMMISIIIESCLVFNEKTGLFGIWVYNIFVGLFGSAAYFIPAGALVIAFFYSSIIEKRTMVFKTVMLAVFSCFLAAVHSIFSLDDLAVSPVSLPDYFSKGYSGEGGGVIGGLAGKLMGVVFGNVFSIILSIVICVVSLSFFLGTTKLGLWLYLRELRMFGAEKTATPKAPKKEPEKISSKEPEAPPVQTQGSTAQTFGQIGSIPAVFGAQRSDPFKYGTEVGMRGAKKQTMSIDLRSPDKKEEEKVRDIYSEETPEEKKPQELKIQQPSLNLGVQSGRAYSPFADPFTKRDDFMRGETKSEPKTAETHSSPSRAYSPFADPFTKKDVFLNRTGSAHDYDAEAEIKVASKTAFAESANSVRSGQASTQGFTPPALGQQSQSIIPPAFGQQSQNAASSTFNKPSFEPVFEKQATTSDNIQSNQQPASDLGRQVYQQSSFVAKDSVSGSGHINTADAPSGRDSDPDQKRESSAPWDISVGSNASLGSRIPTTNDMEGEYTEDVEEDYASDEEGAFAKKEDIPAFSTGAFKNAYADRYNFEKQKAEQSATQEPAYKDHSEKFYPNYVYPSSVLLEQRSAETTVTEDDVIEVRNKLLGKLASFKIEASLVGYSAGPTVTRYELAPGPGVTVKAITNRIEDIGLELQSDGVRIATVPGKSVIGIEVPNKKVSVVSLRSLIENRDFMEAKSKITVCVGLTVTGKPVYMDIDDMPHVLIAGQTKSGKSVAINCMLLSLLYRTTPDEVQLILIDPKRVELNIYSKVPHLAMPVIDDPQRAAAALRWAVNEMERRYEMMDTLGVRNRDEYYELKEQDSSLEYMPQIIIVIDELADLMLQVREHVETLINRLAAKARACGIHLLVGTQRPSVDIVTGLIKANIPARISFQVSSSSDSRIILGSVGAEKLLGRGDMLYQATGAGRVRLQGAFVSSSEIKRVTGFIIENNGEAAFDPEIMRQLDAETDKINKTSKKANAYEDDGDGEFDSDVDFEYICKAMEYIFETKTTTTNNIQRRLRIGFNRAADIVDELENLGFISPRNGAKQRDILIDYEQFEQWKLRNSP